MESKALFSITFREPVRQLFSYVNIIHPITGQAKKIIALWDTGCTTSVITAPLAQELHLTQKDLSTFRGLGTVQQRPTYNLLLQFQKNIPAVPLHVVETDFIENEIDMLIGMDLIIQGDFHITGKDGNISFSFDYKGYQYPVLSTT